MPITLRVKRVKFCFTDTENVYATFNTILVNVLFAITQWTHWFEKVKNKKNKKNFKKLSIRSKILVISLIDINYLLVNDKYINLSRNHFLYIL